MADVLKVSDREEARMPDVKDNGQLLITVGAATDFVALVEAGAEERAAIRRLLGKEERPGE